ncbi:hypothetical protein IMCC3317_03510 [Kordia antarctica]|uniref:Uncharacterized protein n=1 Tax=Kordia antarctica TaxID=1218801 RepID=A0A7L4ZEE3_9FLAO|nr:hypothetical protein [Kordia antarctica]QHI35005.1 hypothetical protein IMCC3317_03510 [Kordia antarctica]
MVLKLAFIALTICTLLFLLIIGFKAINTASSNPKKDKIYLVAGIVSWQLFILLVSSTDFLKSYEFPPRFAIIFILPSFIFTGVFLGVHRNKKWIKSIPEHWIVYFQSFRILVEILFVFALAKGIFNYEVTIEGYNFDMIFAVTAPIMAFLVYTKNVISRKAIIVWNYVGLAVLASVIFLFVASVYQPEIFGSEIPLIPLKSFTYPYVLIAGFLMPVAVFLHVLSIIQVMKTKTISNNVN